jgi:hypothetical protein
LFRPLVAISWMLWAAGCGGSVMPAAGEELLPDGGKPGASWPQCTPGEYHCDGNRLELCNEQGQSFEVVTDCPVECNETDGNCGVCIPGERRCMNANEIAHCSIDGMSELVLPCPMVRPHCIDGSCFQCLDASECPVASQVCEDPVCTPEHACALDYAPLGTPCADGKQCSGIGECCVVNSINATLWPLDIYFMLDRSGSMEGEKWQHQSDALTSFFHAASSAPTSAALRFFPLDDYCLAQEWTCSGEDYVEPLVPFELLPDQAGVLEQAMASTIPKGCVTPTQEALNGVLKGARKRKLAWPEHVVVAVIVSDGGPCCGVCPMEDTDEIGKIVADYLAASPSIPIFSIYVSAGASNVMTTIAVEGGTKAAFDGSSGSASFLQALRDIQAESIPCKLMTDAEVLNPAAASLQYTPAAGGSVQIIPRAEGPSGCDVQGGWYFDLSMQPPQVMLCPAFCDQVKHDAGSRITILLECE